MTTNKNMLESPVERHLYKQTVERGGLCLKNNPLWCIGILDRLVVLKNRIAFVELKRPVGGRLSRTQKYIIKKLTSLGVEAVVLSTKEEIDDWMHKYDSTVQ